MVKRLSDMLGKLTYLNIGLCVGIPLGLDLSRPMLNATILIGSVVVWGISGICYAILDNKKPEPKSRQLMRIGNRALCLLEHKRG